MEKSVSYKDKHYKVRAKTKYDLYIKAAEKYAELASNPEYISLEDGREVEKIKYLHNLYINSLNPTELEVYNEQMETMYIHGTTAIEGNTLTLHETYYLLTEGIVPRKSLREINEVQNYLNIQKFMAKYKGKINLKTIKKLHALIMNNIDFYTAGEFRKTDNVIVLDAKKGIGLALTIPYDLQDIITEYYQKPDFEHAILFHYKYEKIHPFNDGNGRTGREVLNYLLRAAGYPKIIFTKEAREKYISAFDLGDEDKIKEMIKMFVEIYKDNYKNDSSELKKILSD